MALPRFTLRIEDMGVLGILRENVTNPRGVMTSIGALHKSYVAERFVTQGKPKDSFDERMVPNIPGLISDFRKSKTPKARRFESRPVLFDTGRMKGSIDYDVTAPNRVETGSNLPYAAIQHEGGDSESETVTEKMQENLWAWLKSDRGSAWRKDLGWLLNRKLPGTTVPIKVRARPFVELDEDDIDETEELLEEALFFPGGEVMS